MSDRTDAELLRSARRDASAFREFYERWSERLMAYFYRRTFDAEVAADLVADTFAIAFFKASRYRDTGSEPGAWLYGIARRELSRLRRRRSIETRALKRLGVTKPPLDDESIRRIEEVVDAEAYRSTLGAALGRLSSGEREAVRLRVVEDRPYAEVATSLGCSEGTARVRVHRALNRLADWMEPTE